MRKNIHPETHDITVTCACGSAFRTSSTMPEINLTLCSQCHPFFTGDQKFVDTAGRIEKFKKKFEKANKK